MKKKTPVIILNYSTSTTTPSKLSSQQVKGEQENVDINLGGLNKKYFYDPNACCILRVELVLRCISFKFIIITIQNNAKYHKKSV